MKSKVLFILIAVILTMGMGLNVSAASAEPSTYLEFNGNTDGTGTYIEVPDDAKLRLTKNFTMEAWVRWEGTNGHRPFISKPRLDGGGVGTGYILGLSDGKPGIALIGSDSHRGVWSSTPLVKDVWTHVASTYDGMVSRVFVNGEQVAEEVQTTIVDASQGSTSLLIGREFITGLFDRSFGGALHDVRLWNTVLSENVISHIPRNTFQFFNS